MDRMSTPLRADLHCHSTISDGTLTPEQVAERAQGRGVQLWALTDHDEVSGQQRAAARARALGMDYLAGVEVSITFAETTVHIVGLDAFLDRDPAHYGLSGSPTQVERIFPGNMQGNILRNGNLYPACIP